MRNPLRERESRAAESEKKVTALSRLNIVVPLREIVSMVEALTTRPVAPDPPERTANAAAQRPRTALPSG